MTFSATPSYPFTSYLPHFNSTLFNDAKTKEIINSLGDKFDTFVGCFKSSILFGVSFCFHYDFKVELKLKKKEEFFLN